MSRIYNALGRAPRWANSAEFVFGRVIGVAQEIDKELLEILACPDCLGEVHQEGAWIVCDKCGRRYPIRDGLPIMLVEESVAPEGQEQAEGEGESTAE